MATTDSPTLQESTNRAEGAEPKKKLKKVRSTKVSIFSRSKLSRTPTIHHEQIQASALSDSESAELLSGIASLNTKKHAVKKKMKKETKSKKSNQSSEELCTHQPCPTSPTNSEAMINSNNQEKSDISVKILKKTPTLRPVKFLAKMVSLKPKRVSSKKKVLMGYGTMELNVNRPTCSSTIKDSRFCQKDESECKEDSVRKACPYTYCLLHGHQHAPPVPPLKRVMSVRRRMLRTQKSKKQGSPTTVKDKQNSKQRNLQVSSVYETSPQTDSESKGSTPVLDKTKVEDKKQMRTWRLIYQSMLAGKIGAQLKLDRKDEDKPVEDANVLPRENVARDVGVEKDDAGFQERGSRELDVIKLVEEAIDGIFLPEVEDQSSDDQSAASGMTSVNDVLDNNNCEDGKVGFSTSTLSDTDGLREIKRINDDDGVISDRDGTSIAADSISTTAETRTTEVARVANQNIPKNWSKLKKIILLKRFVKALDEVRELKFRENRYLPREPDAEAERVNLRHQTVDDRKKAEEWMLDYALRQVVTKLTPARRRKVEILIDAFESVFPISGIGTLRRSNLDNAEEHDKIVDQARKMELKEDKLIASNVGKGEFDDQPRLEDSDLPEPMVTVKGVQTQRIGINSASGKGANLEVGELTGLKGVSSARNISLNLDDTQEKLDMNNDATPSASASKELADDIAPGKENISAFEGNQEFIEGLPRQSAKPDSNAQAEATQLDKQKYLKMWWVLFHHVVSSGRVNFGTQIQITRAGESLPVDDAAMISATCQSFSETDKHEGADYHNSGLQKINLSQVDAIKLVEDAIDDVVLPEASDELSDDQSITSEQDHLERDVGVSLSVDSENNNLGESDELKKEAIQKTWWKVANTNATEQDETIAKARSESHQKRSGWSNLKKLILLQRFTKALDKAKKFNPREPQYVHWEPEKEAEEVNLRHQTINERLSGEEWMVDHALQQVVARLTPARKRRVELLVEAFETVETVLPLTEKKKNSKQNAAVSQEAKPIQTYSWRLR